MIVPELDRLPEHLNTLFPPLLTLEDVHRSNDPPNQPTLSLSLLKPLLSRLSKELIKPFYGLFCLSGEITRKEGDGADVEGLREGVEEGEGGGGSGRREGEVGTGGVESELGRGRGVGLVGRKGGAVGTCGARGGRGSARGKDGKCVLRAPCPLPSLPRYSAHPA